MEVVIGLIIVFFVFGFAIFVHELGHFLFARMRGVGVEAFAIGMGPKIFAWTRNGTEYSLRWFPVGGFVRLHQMVREEAEEQEREAKLAAMAEEEQGGQTDGATNQTAERKSIGQMAHEDMAALYDKGVVTKLLVFGGGVFFNFLTAMVSLAVLYTIGFNVPKAPIAWVGDVSEVQAFADSGIQAGDYIIDVEGHPVERLDTFEAAQVKAKAAGTDKDGLDIKVRREGAGEVALKLPALDDPSWLIFSTEKMLWEVPPLVGGLDPMAPAAKAGLQEGDLVTRFNDKPITMWSELTTGIRASLEEPIIIHVRRGDSTEEIALSMVPTEDPLNPGLGRVGIAPAGAIGEELIQEPFLQACLAAPKRTVDQVVKLAVLNYKTLTAIAQKSGAKGIKQSLGGPIAIGKMTYERFQAGPTKLLDWFINLNLILLIMNLLPLPVLDGGFIILSLIEGVARRPVSTRILNPIYTAFALCFIGLAIFVSYNDFIKVIF